MGSQKPPKFIRLPAIPPATLAGLALGGILLFAGTPAFADPCEGRLPSKGAAFAGEVRYVGDGDSLCVGLGSDPRTWIEVRLADFYAPELHAAGGRAARDLLERVTKGRRLDCVAQHRSYDRIVALCTIQGVPLGQALRRKGGAEGGNGLGRRP